MPTPSQELRKLLASKLDSFEKLELVLSLSAGARTISDLARELQVGDDVLRRVAATLATEQLVALDGEGASATATLVATADERALLDEARALYDRDRDAIIALLSAISLERLRSMAARSFADAFKIRKKGDDHG